MTRMPQEGLKVTLMAPDLERMYFAMATVTDRDEDGTASFEGRERSTLARVCSMDEENPQRSIVATWKFVVCGRGVFLPLPAGRSRSGSLTQAESAALAGCLPSLVTTQPNPTIRECLQYEWNRKEALPPAAPTYPSEPSISKTKKARMCPGAEKNARNSCTLQWLKRFSTNGTTEEFWSHWDLLTPEQREDYHLGAERLEAEGK
ncbi:hypothetical protein F5141DRAFT_1066090 [Pisolithus sp. B1]|nr:hypothetical protein F5141DRAFT_1066090 [Pisolithus sp. B1]